MSHVHVCLVSDQPIPNLTTSLQLRPDIVVLLTTEEKKEKSKQIERVLKDKGLEVKTKLHGNEVFRHYSELRVL